MSKPNGVFSPIEEQPPEVRAAYWEEVAEILRGEDDILRAQLAAVTAERDVLKAELATLKQEHGPFVERGVYLSLMSNHRAAVAGSVSAKAQVEALKAECERKDEALRVALTNRHLIGTAAEPIIFAAVTPHPVTTRIIHPISKGYCVHGTELSAVCEHCPKDAALSPAQTKPSCVCGHPEESHPSEYQRVTPRLAGKCARCECTRFR